MKEEYVRHNVLKNELHVICEKFIRENNIEVEEDCYQSESTILKYPELMEEILIAFDSAGEINHE